VKWTGLSALTCLGMLGATHHIAAEIGSNPLAWIGPFSAYLFSFLVVFSPGWQPRFTLACLGWLAVSLTGFMFYKGVSYNPVNGPAAWWLLSLTAAGSFFGNGLLRESRPDERSPLFYLMVAAGGVAGSLFASLGAPVLFLRPSELLVASFVLLTFGFLRLAARRDGLTVAIVILIVAAPVVGLVWQQTRAEAAGTLSVRRFRNIHGYKMLQSQENGLVLRSETTTHGTQITTPPEARRRPTLYYTESTGLGRLIAERQEAQASIKVAVIGLGAGTIAAYARPADQVDFWELDPQVIHIARDLFTFVSDSPGQVHIAQEDGRKGLETSHTDYDAIVLDTYAGSSIPAHLLTREAMATYLKLLEKRDGVLAVHATNRYSTLFPLVGATAHSFGCMVLNVVTEIGESAKERDWDFTSTQYILVGRPAGLRGLVRWLPAAEDGGRVKRLVTVYAPEPSGSAGPWTDDRQATLDALDLRHFLSGE
jgi:spermidine synthase